MAHHAPTSTSFPTARSDTSYVIDAAGVSPHDLNETIKAAVAAGEDELVLTNVNGQRFIGAGVTQPGTSIMIEGTPGNDLGMFSENASIIVHGNAQDGVGNTMSSGTVLINGHAGDVVGYGMRGGTVLVKGDAGYRCGISMKEFERNVPVIVVGGRVRDFAGEYMAGGTIVVLGLDCVSRFDGACVGAYTGTGMHAGEIYVREEVDRRLIHPHLTVEEVELRDDPALCSLLRLYAAYFVNENKRSRDKILASTFTKITPATSRPYGDLYSPM